MVVLDTTYLIALERRDPAARALAQRLESDRAPLRIPAIVWIQFLYRIPQAKRGTVSRQLEQSTTFEPLTREIADAAVQMQATLGSRGRKMSWSDLLVAATAAHLNEPLLTSDRNLTRIPGVEVLNH